MPQCVVFLSFCVPTAGCVFAELLNGQPLWPGKSDVDQLYLIRRNLGDLTPRHMEIFKGNSFFKGLTIPTPDKTEPMEGRFPTYSPQIISFMKVCKHVCMHCTYIRTYVCVCVHLCV